MGKKHQLGVKRGKIGNKFNPNPFSIKDKNESKQLAKQFSLRNSANQIKDKRFGERNSKLSKEQKMLKRFQKERLIQSKAGGRRKRLDLESDEEEQMEMTHEGQKIQEDYEGSEQENLDFSDEENEGEEEFFEKKIPDKIVEDYHFGGGSARLTEIQESTGENQQDQPKTSKEIYQEIVEKSKFFKDQKRKQKDQNQDLLDKLDNQFKEIKSQIIDENNQTEEIKNTKRSVSLQDQRNGKSKVAQKQYADYDRLTHELMEGGRALPIQKQNNPIQILTKKKEALENLKLKLSIKEKEKEEKKETKEKKAKKEVNGKKEKKKIEENQEEESQEEENQEEKNGTSLQKEKKQSVTNEFEKEFDNETLSEKYKQDLKELEYLPKLPKSYQRINELFDNRNFIEIHLLLERLLILYSPQLNQEFAEKNLKFLSLAVEYFFFFQNENNLKDCMGQENFKLQEYEIFLKSLHKHFITQPQKMLEICLEHLNKFFQEVTESKDFQSELIFKHMMFFHFLFTIWKIENKNYIIKLASIVIIQLLNQWKFKKQRDLQILLLAFVFYQNYLKPLTLYCPELTNLLFKALKFVYKQADIQEKQRMVEEIQEFQDSEISLHDFLKIGQSHTKKIMHLLLLIYKQQKESFALAVMYKQKIQEIVQSEVNIKFFKENKSFQQEYSQVKRFEIKELEPFILNKVTSIKQARLANSKNMEFKEQQKQNKLFKKEQKEHIKKFQKETQILQKVKKQEKEIEQQQKENRRKYAFKSLTEAEENFKKLKTEQKSAVDIQKRKELKEKRKKKRLAGGDM